MARKTERVPLKSKLGRGAGRSEDGSDTDRQPPPKMQQQQQQQQQQPKKQQDRQHLHDRSAVNRTEPAEPDSSLLALAAQPEVLVLTFLVILGSLVLWMQHRGALKCSDPTANEVASVFRRGIVHQVQHASASGPVSDKRKDGDALTHGRLADATQLLKAEFSRRLELTPDALRRAVDCEGGSMPPKMVSQEVDFYSEFVSTATQENTEELRQRMCLKGFDLLLHNTYAADTDTPGDEVAYYVAFSPSRRLVVISIQDSMSVEGYISALSHAPSSSPVPFLLYEPRSVGQRYVAKKAQRIASEMRAALLELFVPQGYAVGAVGHGVGAGIASVLAILLREECGVRSIRGVCVAPPPCIDRNSALGCKAFVTSVVHNSDVLPRSSLPALTTFSHLLHSISLSLAEAGPSKTVSQLPNLLRDAQKAAATAAGSESGNLYLPGSVLYMFLNTTGGYSATLLDGTLTLLRNYEVGKTRTNNITPPKQNKYTIFTHR